MSADENQLAIDGLGGEQDARVREVGVMVPTDGRLTNSHLEEIRDAGLKYIKRRGYSQGLVAAKLGSNETYISNFLGGRFDQIPAATLQKLARDLNNWLDSDNRRKLREEERETVLVPTVVPKRLQKCAEHAIETNDCVVAHGPAGCGKSVSLAQLALTIAGAMLIYITPDCTRKNGFLRALYAVVWQHRAPARPTLSDVIERLKFSDRLLMLDNADLLTPDVFPVLMVLHDVAKIPILIVGTYKLVEKFDHDADPLRGQMSSRIGMRAELLAEQTSPRKGNRRTDWIRVDEIRAIFERGRIKLHPTAAARLKDIANTEIGRLRRCERLVRYAALYAGSRTAQIVITPEVLDKAIALVDGKSAPVRTAAPAVAEAAG